MDNNEIIVARLRGAYQYLVEETDNPNTATSRIKRRLLSKLLEFCEYLLVIQVGEEGNPLTLWFE